MDKDKTDIESETIEEYADIIFFLIRRHIM
jgi:hypothetical protein